MSYVNHKTSTPGGSDLYGYAFLTLPNPKSPSNPKGVTIDDKILPARDIHDLSASTDTWKEMHGVDLYFLEEGVAERYYAPRQFILNNRTPTSPFPPDGWQAQTSLASIQSNSWRNVCGRWDEVGQPNTHSGIGWCYKELFLNISSETQLSTEIYTWPDGSDIETFIPTGLPHAGKYVTSYPVDAIAPLNQGMMISHLSDFQTGSPLSAEPIRQLYKDMEKLQYYMLTSQIDVVSALTNTYHGQIWLSSWRKSASNYYNMTPLYPDRPEEYMNQEIIQEIQFARGNPTERGYYEIWESSDGYYRVPYCGKTGQGAGTYDNIWGSEVAVYVCLRLEWSTKYGEWQPYKRAFFKGRVTINRISGFLEIRARDLVIAGYRLINHYNAEIPHSIAPRYEDARATYVVLEGIYPICKLTDRTDTTQLNWNKRPQ